jgi:hypothetical protein
MRISALEAEFVAFLANAPDIARLKKLEDDGYFAPGFTQQAGAAICRYVLRLFDLRATFSVLPYPGPTITTE